MTSKKSEDGVLERIVLTFETACSKLQGAFDLYEPFK